MRAWTLCVLALASLTPEGNECVVTLAPGIGRVDLIAPKSPHPGPPAPTRPHLRTWNLSAFQTTMHVGYNAPFRVGPSLVTSSGSSIPPYGTAILPRPAGYLVVRNESPWKVRVEAGR